MHTWLNFGFLPKFSTEISIFFKNSDDDFSILQFWLSNPRMTLYVQLSFYYDLFDTIFVSRYDLCFVVTSWVQFLLVRRLLFYNNLGCSTCKSSSQCTLSVPLELFFLQWPCIWSCFYICLRRESVQKLLGLNICRSNNLGEVNMMGITFTSFFQLFQGTWT